MVIGVGGLHGFVTELGTAGLGAGGGEWAAEARQLRIHLALLADRPDGPGAGPGGRRQTAQFTGFKEL